MKKYILLSTLFIFLTACSTQDMAGLVNGNLANLVKIKKKTSNSRSYTRKKNCSYYSKKYGRYSAPAKACRNMQDCSKYRKYGANNGVLKSCLNSNKRDQWTMDSYDKTEKSMSYNECGSMLDVSYLAWKKCHEKAKARKARRR